MDKSLKLDLVRATGACHVTLQQVGRTKIWLTRARSFGRRENQVEDDCHCCPNLIQSHSDRTIMPPKHSSAALQTASKSKGKFSLASSKSQQQPNNSSNHAAGKRKRTDNHGRAQGAASDASDEDDDDLLNEEQENGDDGDDNDTDEEIENAKEGKSKKTQSECVRIAKLITKI